MRVLFWVNSFPLVSETFIRNQIVDLIDNGIDVKILCTHKNEDTQGIEGFEHYNLLSKTVDFKRIIPELKKEKRKKAIEILMKGFFSKNFFYFLNFVFLLVSNRKKNNLRSLFILDYIIKNKINVLHCHFGPVGKEAVFLKKIGLSIKLICTFHGYDIRLGIKHEKSFYEELFKYADTIISISNYNKKMLLSFGLNEKKIVELNNGVTLAYEESRKGQLQNKVSILSVGRLVEEKGYDLALDAFSNFCKKYPHLYFHYNIIGGGVLEEKLKKKCHDLNLDSLVTFHMAQNSEYVKGKLLEADLFFLPSISEAIPTVILEAQSYSLPVIATNVGSVKDLVVNDITGFLCNDVVNDIVDCLKKMFDNREKWNIYGVNAKKNIALNYDRNILVKKLIEIYK